MNRHLTRPIISGLIALVLSSATQRPADAQVPPAVQGTPSAVSAGVPATLQPETVPALAPILEQKLRPRFLKHDAAMNLDVWWLMAESGQPRPMYTSADGRFLYIAMIYDAATGGNAVLPAEVEEISALMKADGPLSPAATVAALPVETPAAAQGIAAAGGAPAASPAPQTKANRVLGILANAPYVELGKPGAPLIYAVVDPQCPYCHQFYQAIQPALDQGTVRVRLVISAALPNSQPMSTALLSAADLPGEWRRFSETGKLSTIPTSTGNAVLTRNEKTRHDLDAVIGGTGVPLIVYDSKAQGRLGFFRGITADNVPVLVNDAGPLTLPTVAQN